MINNFSGKKYCNHIYALSFVEIHLRNFTLNSSFFFLYIFLLQLFICPVSDFLYGIIKSYYLAAFTSRQYIFRKSDVDDDITYLPQYLTLYFYHAKNQGKWA